MQVKLFDPEAVHAPIRDEIEAAIDRVLDKGNFVMGEEVEAFEEEWAKYCVAKYCIGVSSASDGLYLAIQAVLTRYDGPLRDSYDVLTTPLTFWATTEAIIRAGQYEEFQDVGLKTGVISHIDSGDKICIPVSLFGYPHGCQGKWVIEDLSHAHGHKLRGKVAVYSHYPTKNLGAFGMAGSIVTNNRDIADFIRSARIHSETKNRFEHNGVTGNFRMDEIQAAVLRVKMKYLEKWHIERKIQASRYKVTLQSIPGIALQEDHDKHVYHIYAIRLKERDKLRAFLASKGIETGLRYTVPCHLQPALFSNGYKRGRFPNAELWADTVLNLPIYPGLSLEKQEYVINSIKEWSQDV